MATMLAAEPRARKAARNGNGAAVPPCGSAADPAIVAKSAGLRYVVDTSPGIRRESVRSDWRYTLPSGETVTDGDELQRIRKLAIPPAWTDVWICPRPNGHLQATGRDARGRKQYRYHAKWHEVRDEAKYGRMIAFGETLPAIRDRTDADLSRPGLPQEKVLATVVRLLETTLIRVGNEEYARANDSYGLTTMRDEHVDISGSTIRFEFRGKSGKDHSVGIRDRRLARIIARCRDIEGQELFQYHTDDGAAQSLDSGAVNAYLREISGEEFTAKDFRTWAGTALAAAALEGFEPFESEAEAKRNVTRAIELVAQRLGNTPAICRKCYVHPAVLESYVDGKLHEELTPDKKGLAAGLEPPEAAVLSLIRKRTATS